MAYNTPELTLVGAAENLVFGPGSKFDPTHFNYILDAGPAEYSETLLNDEANW
jgi:hypothetical protein